MFCMPVYPSSNSIPGLLGPRSDYSYAFPIVSENTVSVDTVTFVLHPLWRGLIPIYSFTNRPTTVPCFETRDVGFYNGCGRRDERSSNAELGMQHCDFDRERQVSGIERTHHASTCRRDILHGTSFHVCDATTCDVKRVDVTCKEARRSPLSLSSSSCWLELLQRFAIGALYLLPP